MKIILLGTGTPVLDPACQQSALLVDINGERLLFDAGRGVTSQMEKWVFDPSKLTLHSSRITTTTTSAIWANSC
jgi:ribonuclease BN (tRNA processing enzyme)